MLRPIVTIIRRFNDYWPFAEKIFVKQSLGTVFEILLKILRYALEGEGVKRNVVRSVKRKTILPRG